MEGPDERSPKNVLPLQKTSKRGLAAHILPRERSLLQEVSSGNVFFSVHGLALADTHARLARPLLEGHSGRYLSSSATLSHFLIGCSFTQLYITLQAYKHIGRSGLPFFPDNSRQLVFNVKTLET